MSKKSKSKRFTQQGVDSVKQHDQRFPYHERLADAEKTKEKADEQSLGGF
ncbi:competence protein [Aquibacillus koreensis]|uniref:Competence protein n=1 Tax=Aquibacillus koreensis TaxID=279446 RepID=A0A9X3WJK5_9BACI|nr:competence protein [Aquibacillus koreensis]MCT2535627.1 competence protein [Aquibacillus koreensis]MDC3420088.1 competence protein [Aquibacillus koreensis]